MSGCVQLSNLARWWLGATSLCRCHSHARTYPHTHAHTHTHLHTHTPTHPHAPLAWTRADASLNARGLKARWTTTVPAAAIPTTNSRARAGPNGGWVVTADAPAVWLALQAFVSFLYHNLDLIHGAWRHRLLNNVIKVGFSWLFLHPCAEVVWGFQHLLVFKLLRFHRHHSHSASDMTLLTEIGSNLLHVEQTDIMELMQRVGERKTHAANPAKGTFVEELDIDHALMSQLEVLIDLVRAHHLSLLSGGRAAPPKESSDATLDAGNGGGGGGTGGGDRETDAHSAAAPTDDHKQDQGQADDRPTIPPGAAQRVRPALANYARLLWQYYCAGLKDTNDIALSVFAPPLNFHLASSIYAADRHTVTLHPPPAPAPAPAAGEEQPLKQRNGDNDGSAGRSAGGGGGGGWFDRNSRRGPAGAPHEHVAYQRLDHQEKITIPTP